MLDPDRRRLLGEFLRAHRERAQPADPAGRRRTPGLRREELASKAGISATWCAWIEQGREVQVSPDALRRLSDALGLSTAERTYLFELAGRVDPLESSESEIDASASIRSAVAALYHPAYGLDRLWNATCWNDAARGLFRGWLDGQHQRNLLRFVFLDAAARTLIPEWEDRARRLLAEFRADFGHNFRDERVRALVEELRAGSPLFAMAWLAQDVQQREGGLRTFADRQGGLQHFIQHSFNPADRPDHKLVLLVPAATSKTAAP